MHTTIAYCLANTIAILTHATTLSHTRLHSRVCESVVVSVRMYSGVYASL